MLKTCCFTGHRPQKLPWRFDETDERCTELKLKISTEIEKAIQRGYTHFISGMALGCDIYFAEAVLNLKLIYPHIELECAIAYETQTSKWSSHWRERYFDIVAKCDKETLLARRYYNGCLMERNIYMVDKSSLLIAAYIENKRSGARNTFTYAKAKRIKIISIIISK